MYEPLELINNIKEALKSIIKENNYKYLDDDITILLKLYSSDLCSILISFFPDATIMINKKCYCCALMINGKIYDSEGINSIDDFYAASSQDILFIKRSFPHLSEDIMDKLVEKVSNEENSKSKSYTLRKEHDNII